MTADGVLPTEEVGEGTIEGVTEVAEADTETVGEPVAVGV